MRAFITIIVLLFLIIFGIVLLHKPQNSRTNPVVAKNLVDYAGTNADVKLTIDGIINGDDIHRQVRITVNSSERVLDVIGGYNGNVINNKSYGNNPAAFKVFLQALKLAGFTRTRSSTIVDYQGYCPLNQRYYYQLENTGDSKTDLFMWGSACGGGTQAGQGALIRSLFQKQISDYTALTNNVIL